MLAKDGIEKPQCVLCHVVLNAESMKPSKLSSVISTKHPEYAKKDLDFFKKSHTMVETLLKPCMMKGVNLVLGETSAKELQQVSLSNNTIHRQISKMYMDVKEQVLTEINASPLFSLISALTVNRCKFMFSVTCRRTLIQVTLKMYYCSAVHFKP